MINKALKAQMPGQLPNFPPIQNRKSKIQNYKFAELESYTN